MLFNFRKYASVVALIALMGLNMSAASIDVNTARSTANSFLKRHMASPGAINSPSMADLKLIHAEASSVDRNAKAYYAFNVTGGGFIIVSGDDRASEVLGYSDEGMLDFNNMPDNLKVLLDIYKEEIEYLQAQPKLKVPKRTYSSNRNIIVEPLVQVHWGQLKPYYLQCPITPDGKYGKVGCSGVQMAQICHYWQYPITCGPIAGYYCSSVGATLEELPITTFDYSKMLTSYCHWDMARHDVVQDVYTEEQAQEVAKLCRYVGQAAHIDYSPYGSGTDGNLKLAGMKTLGYNPDAISVSRNDGYTDEAWDNMIKAELDAHRPVMYGARNAASDVGHAIIFDGYDSEGYFHINLGWFGVSDGWFLSTAITPNYLDGTPRNYSKLQYMFLDIRPPFYCNIDAQSINTNDSIFLLGGLFRVLATGVNISTTYDSVDLFFSLTDSDGNIVATSDTINVVKNEFSQHSNINSSIIWPESLAEGTYNLQFNYIDNNEAKTIVTKQGQLKFAGRLARFDSSFKIDDLTDLINILLLKNQSLFTVDDLTNLINYLLTN